MKNAVRLLHAVLLWCLCYGHAIALTLQDDSGVNVTLPHPAQRIISLAPHITEILFAAGAGTHVVGTVSYSDYPAAAKKIPLVGSYDQVNFEKILQLRPDLVIGWQSGNNSDSLAKIRALGLPLYLSEPKDLTSIAHNIRQMGFLAGTTLQADATADRFNAKLAALTQQYSHKPVLTVFYQVWDEPLYTLGGGHFSRDMFRICGGRNIFADLTAPSPIVSVEAVITRNPQVMLAGADHGQRKFSSWMQRWEKWPSIAAVHHHQLYLVNQDIYTRPSPRAIEGTEDLCKLLDKARQVYFPEGK